MSEVGTYTIEDGIGVIVIDNPPVNALGIKTRIALDEGTAIRASDVDVAAILDYGWPVYTGGPMFWADTVDLSRIVAGLEAMGIEPAALLRTLADAGKTFTRG